LLRQALDAYRQAAEEMDQIEQARQLADDLIARFPDYLIWFGRAGRTAASGSPRAENLRRLLEALDQLIVAADDPEEATSSVLKDLCNRVRQEKAKIEAPLGQPETAAPASGT